MCEERASSYQSLGSAVQSMSVVAAELGVNALQRRVTGRLGLGDTTGWSIIVILRRCV
jgi:hypothetical protein